MTAAEFDEWLKDADRPPLVMGVLNVTPDSFSDGGRFADPDAAVAHARSMVDAGAAILDVGGESTRPGSARSPADVQIARVVPVIERIARELASRALVSIDTTRSAVARAALDAGAAIVNDISGATDDPAILTLAAERGAPVVLMHMQGQPATMQVNPSYRNVVDEVREFLAGRVTAATAAGIAPHRVMLDPGIGFGKNMGHNLELLRRVGEFADLAQPLVLGTSRKGFIGRISGESDPADRVMGTAATVAWCVANRASVVRVHDVEPMVRVVRVIRAIQAGWPGPP
jgi:dihydropteroate synthase